MSKGNIRKITVTSDGSDTVYDPLFDEHFHSVFGAVTESECIFINAGLEKLLLASPPCVKILEIGFGTGLNLLLSILEMKHFEIPLYYEGVELFPIEDDILKSLNYSKIIKDDDAGRYLKMIHISQWDVQVALDEKTFIRKIRADAISYDYPAENYNLIYFDAFSPEKQPLMWSPELLGKIAAALMKGGIFVTYSVRGDVRRHLTQAGLYVEKLAGPPGKRQILRGMKH